MLRHHRLSPVQPGGSSLGPLIITILLVLAYLGWKYFPDIHWPGSEPAKQTDTQQLPPPIADEALPPEPASTETLTGPSRAKGNLLTVFTSDDYPLDALRREEQGTVSTRLEIGADGKVATCIIVQSSGSDTLDQATCRIFLNRLRMQPARDANGKPTTDTVSQRVTWRLPED